MARLLYCRHEDCHEAYVSEAGHRPALCPACNRVGSWTTISPLGILPTVYPDDPQRPYRLSENDRTFLKSIRVMPRDATDEDDGA